MKSSTHHSLGLSVFGLGDTCQCGIIIFIADVAMVIIITMVAKIYFPEALERLEPIEAINTRSRTINYRRVADEELEDNNYYSSDEENKAGDSDDDEKANDGDGKEGRSLMKSYSDSVNSKNSNARQNIEDSPLEFRQEHTSKASVLSRLVFCVIMLNVTFVTWGVLQERMLTRRYPRFTGEFFTYSYALVFTNRFWTMLMSGCLMLYLKPRRSCSTIIYEYSFPSISNMLSSWCQYESLRYVSFPAVTLVKSFKLAPVMAMGKFLGNKQCKLHPVSDELFFLCPHAIIIPHSLLSHTHL